MDMTLVPFMQGTKFWAVIDLKKKHAIFVKINLLYNARL
jgi:hypothetical protein